MAIAVAVRLFTWAVANFLFCSMTVLAFTCLHRTVLTMSVPLFNIYIVAAGIIVASAFAVAVAFTVAFIHTELLLS
jgi:hypothetical protein